MNVNNEVKEAGLAVAVQSLGEALSPGKAIGKINNGHQEKKAVEPVAAKPTTMADRVRQARENIAAWSSSVGDGRRGSQCRERRRQREVLHGLHGRSR